MTALFGDESGGWNAGVMVFAMLAIRPAAADRIISRYRAVSGIAGEVKGSRIGMVDRAFLLERLVAEDGRIWAAVATRRDASGTALSDLTVYRRLLDHAVDAAVTNMRTRRPADDRLDIAIDAGRYDDGLLGSVMRALRTRVGADMVVSSESHRSAGVQLADVVANCLYNVELGGSRGARVHAIIEPWLADGTVTVEHLAIG